jgi:hypothetical protein
MPSSLQITLWTGLPDKNDKSFLPGAPKPPIYPARQLVRKVICFEEAIRKKNKLHLMKSVCLLTCKHFSSSIQLN